MNFTLNYIKIRSSWFNDKSDTNIYKEIGYDGFYLYITLFRFRIHQQSHLHTFITSISLLRKEMSGYRTEKIFALLQLLVRNKLISMDNISKFSLLMDEEDKIKSDKILIIHATDIPNTVRKMNNQGIEFDDPADKPHDYYISVNLPMFQLYIGRKLNERYFGLYCLMQKLSNVNIERKPYMDIGNMARTLGFDKDYVNKMVRQLNREYLLYSKYRDNGKDGEKFEHRLCPNVKSVDTFYSGLKEYIDKNIQKWDRKMNKKSITEPVDTKEEILAEVHYIADPEESQHMYQENKN